MNDYVLMYIVTLAFICVLGALFCVYRYFLGNKLLEQAAKLKSQMAKIRQDFPYLDEKPNEMVAGALGDIGINGIMQELGIDPGILKNPLVKGLVDKYAPRVLEQLSKHGTNTKTEETSFL
jgi:hypothetical protein